jgi:hypothetical protein
MRIQALAEPPLPVAIFTSYKSCKAVNLNMRGQ